MISELMMIFDHKSYWLRASNEGMDLPLGFNRETMTVLMFGVMICHYEYHPHLTDKEAEA